MLSRIANLILATALGFVPATASAADKVNLTLSFGKAGKDAGVYVALDKGFFRDANIDLTIIAGTGAGIAATNVETGNSQFGATDFGNIIAARANQGTIKSVMLLYDLSPLAVASLKDKIDLASPRAFEGHSVAAPIGSTIRVQLPVLFKINGVDPATVKLVHIPGSAFVQTLFRGDVDITSAFLNESGVALQIEADKAGKTMSWLRLRDFGLDVYAVTIITSDALIAKNPDLVRRMVGALVKGYTFMAQNPDDAAQIMLKRVPEVPADVTLGQVRQTADLARSKAFADHGYGWASPEKLRFTVDTLSQALDVKTKVNPQDVHTNEFLPLK